MLNLTYFSECTSSLSYSFPSLENTTFERPGYNLGSFAVNDTIEVEIRSNFSLSGQLIAALTTVDLLSTFQAWNPLYSVCIDSNTCVLKTNNITTAGTAVLKIFPVGSPPNITILQIIVRKNGVTILAVTDVLRDYQFKYFYNSKRQNINITLTGVSIATRATNLPTVYSTGADKFVIGNELVPTSTS
jgi:hypothetical protein